MTIKQAQQLSGVSADNIRFYEKQGLLRPARSRDNDYRDYSQADIRTLKLIRALRMLDIPLEEVRAVLTGSLPLPTAATQQQKRLEERAQRLEEAIRLCGEFSGEDTVEALDVDALLARMDNPQSRDGFFRGWLRDYRRVALAEHEKSFTFLPDGAVTTPREFSEALFQYARENGLELVITRESMYPEFTIDGVEYTATRNYMAVWGCPVASIHCEVLHPEDFEPRDIPPLRRRTQRIFYFLWGPALFLLFFLLPRRWMLFSWDGLAILLFTLTIVGVISFFSWLLFFNQNGKQ